MLALLVESTLKVQEKVQRKYTESTLKVHWKYRESTDARIAGRKYTESTRESTEKVQKLKKYRESTDAYVFHTKYTESTDARIADTKYSESTENRILWRSMDEKVKVQKIQIHCCHLGCLVTWSSICL